jgi:hypothetical protein
MEEAATPDMQLIFAPRLSAGARQMRSRGYVEAKSNRPGNPPTIDPVNLPRRALGRI